MIIIFRKPFAQQRDVFPWPFLCKLGAVNEEYYLAPVISYTSNQVDFAVCDTAGQILRLLNQAFEFEFCQSCPSSYKPMFSDYDQDSGQHAVLLTEERQIFIRSLESGIAAPAAPLDLNTLLEEAFRSALWSERPLPASLQPMGMRFSGAAIAILVQSTENSVMKYLISYDLQEGSVRLIPIARTDTFAFSWEDNELVSLSFAMPGQQRWLRFWQY